MLLAGPSWCARTPSRGPAVPAGRHVAGGPCLVRPDPESWAGRPGRPPAGGEEIAGGLEGHRELGVPHEAVPRPVVEVQLDRQPALAPPRRERGGLPDVDDAVGGAVEQAERDGEIEAAARRSIVPGLPVARLEQHGADQATGTEREVEEVREPVDRRDPPQRPHAWRRERGDRAAGRDADQREVVGIAAELLRAGAPPPLGEQRVVDRVVDPPAAQHEPVVEAHGDVAGLGQRAQQRLHRAHPAPPTDEPAAVHQQHRRVRTGRARSAHVDQRWPQRTARVGVAERPGVHAHASDAAWNASSACAARMKSLSTRPSILWV